HTKIALPKLRTAGISAAREGEAFQISERRFALPEQLLLLSEGVLKLAEAGEEISVIALKQQWGLGRNLVVEIVEFFDSVRFTARRDNARIILDAALPQKLFGGEEE
ncbi:MAG: SelB C-terminal domain-containing protein, partial [Halioglobus sp.]